MVVLNAYCLKSHCGVRGFYASLWRFLLRCTLFSHSAATFLTSVSSYEGGCGFDDIVLSTCFITHKSMMYQFPYRKRKNNPTNNIYNIHPTIRFFQNRKHR